MGLFHRVKEDTRETLVHLFQGLLQGTWPPLSHTLPPFLWLVSSGRALSVGQCERGERDEVWGTSLHSHTWLPVKNVMFNSEAQVSLVDLLFISPHCIFNANLCAVYHSKHSFWVSHTDSQCNEHNHEDKDAWEAVHRVRQWEINM